jgi:hypothetical protein
MAVGLILCLLSWLCGWLARGVGVSQQEATHRRSQAAAELHEATRRPDNRSSASARPATSSAEHATLPTGDEVQAAEERYRQQKAQWQRRQAWQGLPATLLRWAGVSCLLIGLVGFLVRPR